MRAQRYLFLSDIHLCKAAWYGISSEERLRRMAQQLRARTAEVRFDEMFLLGDLSLDFWAYEDGGTYLHTPPVSNTGRYLREFAPELPMKPHLLPGNHEQYGEELWKKLTGYSRSYTFAPENGDAPVFVMLDTFGGDLDPAENSDGTFTPCDCVRVRAALDAYPGRTVILCAHWFSPEQESDEFRALVSGEPRIAVLLMGHTHRSAVLERSFGEKAILQCGNFSYSSENPPETSFWGWRELEISENGTISSYYYVPAQTTPVCTVECHRQDFWTNAG